MSVVTGSLQALGRHKLLALVGLVVVLGMVTTLVVRPWANDSLDDLAADVGAGDRVLQSVAVKMQPDGSLTDIDGTLMVSADGGKDTTTRTESYNPKQVANDLPVRVLTSWRTKKGTGTDLSDLSGYTGRVQVDLTVENLTVAPRSLEYDVAGESRKSSAMVGVPLTVVASADLKDTEVASVITKADDEKVTNGVLSQGKDKSTQVQWASILAPPQLDSSVTLRLVVDARDFTPPSFDLSIQPGLVADPSLGALVDAAFNPASSEELQLQSRTIKLIGEVNTVLARASETITGVRDTLESTSETLGAKTVQDLRDSTEQITTSMQSFDESLQGLDQDLSSSLQQTGSAMIDRLQATVQALDVMLGDTSVKPPVVDVTGEGCETVVEEPRAGDSLYGSLLEVVAQLNGYAQATYACKGELQKLILETVGPPEPTPETCVVPSVTCSLEGVKKTFAQVAEQLVEDGQEALDNLDASKIESAADKVSRLSGQLALVVQKLNEVPVINPADSAGKMLDAILADNMPLIDEAIDNSSDEINALHSLAVANSKSSGSMLDQNAETAARICAVVGDQPGELDAQDAERIRALLVTQSCPAADGSTTPLNPGLFREAMETRLTSQRDAWNDIAARTDLGDTGTALGRGFEVLRNQHDGVISRIREAKAKMQTDYNNLARSVDELQDLIDDMDGIAAQLYAEFGDVKETYAQVKAEMTAAFESAGQTAEDQVAASIDPEIRRISEQSRASREDIGRMFQTSVRGLTGAASTIRRDGAETLNRQRGEFKDQQDAAAAATSQQITAALAMISGSVASSTRDLGAAQAMLTTDLTNVLLDLGTREVRGSGLLGAMATGAATADTADFQLALASDKASSYAEVRGRDMAGIQLRQAQAEAALRMQAELPPFRLELPPATDYRTVYLLHIQGGQ